MSEAVLQRTKEVADTDLAQTRTILSVLDFRLKLVLAINSLSKESENSDHLQQLAYDWYFPKTSIEAEDFYQDNFLSSREIKQFARFQRELVVRTQPDFDKFYDSIQETGDYSGRRQEIFDTIYANTVPPEALFEKLDLPSNPEEVNSLLRQYSNNILTIPPVLKNGIQLLKLDKQTLDQLQLSPNPRSREEITQKMSESLVYETMTGGVGYLASTVVLAHLLNNQEFLDSLDQYNQPEYIAAGISYVLATEALVWLSQYQALKNSEVSSRTLASFFKAFLGMSAFASMATQRLQAQLSRFPELFLLGGLSVVSQGDLIHALFVREILASSVSLIDSSINIYLAMRGDKFSDKQQRL